MKTRLAVTCLAACLILISATACRPPPRTVEVTRVVTQNVVENAQLVEVTRLVAEVREIVASPTPIPPLDFVDPDPGTFIQLIGGDVATFDPALAYDATSGEALQNIYEGLVTFDPADTNTLIPALAEVVPDVTNGGNPRTA